MNIRTLSAFIFLLLGVFSYRICDFNDTSFLLYEKRHSKPSQIRLALENEESLKFYRENQNDVYSVNFYDQDILSMRESQQSLFNSGSAYVIYDDPSLFSFQFWFTACTFLVPSKKFFMRNCSQIYQETIGNNKFVYLLGIPRFVSHAIVTDMENIDVFPLRKGNEYHRMFFFEDIRSLNHETKWVFTFLDSDRKILHTCFIYHERATKRTRTEQIEDILSKQDCALRYPDRNPINIDLRTYEKLSLMKNLDTEGTLCETLKTRLEGFPQADYYDNLGSDTATVEIGHPKNLYSESHSIGEFGFLTTLSMSLSMILF